MGRWMMAAVGAVWAIRAVAAPGDTAAPRPLAFFDQSPTVAIYGLPRADGYTVAAPGRWHTGLKIDYTSHFSEQAAPGETLVFDGETTRAALVFERGFDGGWQLALAVPFVNHSGGFADGFIDDFHGAFGFSDGGRDSAPSGRQRFSYARDGRLQLDIEDSPSGIGDLRLSAKRRLADLGGWGSAVAASVKLPTGDADELTGSGGTDVALWATLGNNASGDARWRLLAGAGGIYTSNGDVLAAQRVNTVAFGWATLGFALTRRLVVKAQAYAHGAFYDETALDALGATAVQGALGLDWQAFEQSRLSFAIIEDLDVGASPDVSFNLGITHAF